MIAWRVAVFKMTEVPHDSFPCGGPCPLIPMTKPNPAPSSILHCSSQSTTATLQIRRPVARPFSLRAEARLPGNDECGLQSSTVGPQVPPSPLPTPPNHNPMRPLILGLGVAVLSHSPVQLHAIAGRWEGCTFHTEALVAHSRECKPVLQRMEVVLSTSCVQHVSLLHVLMWPTAPHGQWSPFVSTAFLHAKQLPTHQWMPSSASKRAGCPGSVAGTGALCLLKSRAALRGRRTLQRDCLGKQPLAIVAADTAESEAGRGRRLLAAEDLPSGTEILAEDPVIQVSGEMGMDAVARELLDLDPVMQESLLELCQSSPLPADELASIEDISGDDDRLLALLRVFLINSLLVVLKVERLGSLFPKQCANAS